MIDFEISRHFISWICYAVVSVCSLANLLDSSLISQDKAGVYNKKSYDLVNGVFFVLEDVLFITLP
jgi:hypothetical protein